MNSSTVAFGRQGVELQPETQDAGELEGRRRQSFASGFQRLHAAPGQRADGYYSHRKQPTRPVLHDKSISGKRWSEMIESEASGETTPTTAVAVQPVLAEKRTSMSMVRTTIAVLALPLGLTGTMIATSKLYDPNDVRRPLAGLAVVDIILLGVGFLLII